MADSINPYQRAADTIQAGLNPPKPAPAAKPAPAPKAPKGPEYEPLPVQPDENSEYMGKQLAKIASKINTKGQELMKGRLMKTGSTKSSSKR